MRTASLYSMLFAALLCGSARAGSLDLSFAGVDDADRAVTLGDWSGKHVVLTMAYSECRRICSTTVKLLSDIQRAAAAAGKTIEVIVVSLDPGNDTPQSWRTYREMHKLQHTNWHFVTAKQAATTRLAKQLGFEYWRYGEHVMHDLRIVRLAPSGAIAATMDWHRRDVDAFLAGVPLAP